MYRNIDERHLNNTISIKPTYQFDTDYLQFHINKSKNASNQQLPQISLSHRHYSPHSTHKHGQYNNNSVRKDHSSNKRESFGLTAGFRQNDQEIKRIIQRYDEIKDGDNEMMKSIVQEELLYWMHNNNQIMAKLNKYLVESLVLLGTIHTYKSQETIPQWQGKICFIIYGKVKAHNKDIRLVVTKGQTFGQHLLFDFKAQLKVKALEQTCLLILPLKNYHTIRQQSIKNGLKNEFSGIEIALRLSFIRKKLGQSKKRLII